MVRCASVTFGLLSTLLVAVAVADQPEQANANLPTLMCERGKLIFSDDFSEGPSDAWRVPKGKWEAKAGATQGSELKADKHGAVIRTNLPVRNAVIQYSFMLEGAKATTFSINDAQGHNSRVIINAAGFAVRKDDHDHKGPDKAALLQQVKKAIPQDRWNTLVIELNGPEILARLNGDIVAYGSHKAIDVDKTNIGLTVAGESVSFKDMQIWEAEPKADWTTTKAKLLKQ